MSDHSVQALPISQHAPGELNAGSIGALVAAMTGTLLGPGPMIVAGFSLLITAAAHDTGWSRATFSMIMPVISWTAAPTAPLYGRLMDRFGVRRGMIAA